MSLRTNNKFENFGIFPIADHTQDIVFEALSKSLVKKLPLQPIINKHNMIHQAILIQDHVFDYEYLLLKTDQMICENSYMIYNSNKWIQIIKKAFFGL